MLKKFFKTFRLKNLGNLNWISNFQDTVILCEMFEQRANVLLSYQQMLNLLEFLKKQWWVGIVVLTLEWLLILIFFWKTPKTKKFFLKPRKDNSSDSRLKLLKWMGTISTEWPWLGHYLLMYKTREKSTKNWWSKTTLKINNFRRKNWTYFYSWYWIFRRESKSTTF